MRSILLAFAMFSRLPMPWLEWSERNMRYVMAAFPLVGIVVGLAAAAWLALCGVLEIGPFLRGVGFALVPFLLTGGIHMDGFSDTTDALASNGDREKKQRILKDPHVGPFAAFTACAYLLAFAALASEADLSLCPALCFVFLFVLSRALTGLGVVLCPTAEGSSLGKAFHDAAVKKTSTGILFGLLVVSGGFIAVFGGVAGIAAVVACLGTAWVAKRIALTEFGGMSGDLSGWSLQLCELVGLFFLTFGVRVVDVLRLWGEPL